METIEKLDFKDLPKNKKILLIRKITIFNIFFLVLLKSFFNKIFFLKIATGLRKKKLLSILENFGFFWASYNDFDIAYINPTYTKKATEFCDKYSKDISKKIWVKSFKPLFVNKDYLSACINFKIKDDILELFEILEFGKLLKKNNKVCLILSNNFFFKKINETYKIKNLNIFNTDIIKSLKFILFNFIKFFFKVLKFIFLSNFKKKPKIKKNKLINEKKNFNVAFFPHKGIYSQKNNLKDQFYLNKKNSKFYKKHIAHIEWNGSDLDEKSKNYYQTNNIPVYLWDNLSFKRKSIFKTINFFIFRLNLIFHLYKFSVLDELLSSVYNIENSKEKIKNYFPKLKYLLVGYDLLFTIDVCMAARILNIETVSIQDRIIVPSWSHCMIFDHYFILGPASKKVIKKRMSKTVKNFYKNQILNNNIKIIKKIKNNQKKLKCLVIDLSSFEEKDWYLNGRSIASWNSNYRFYKLILNLSKKYSNISFYIKSKNYIWLKTRVYKKLKKFFVNQKNVYILKNQKIWTPIKSIKFTDFAIAKYSSLSDQMLYINKPIIIYNNDKFPSLLFNFSEKLIANNPIELENKIDSITKNYDNYNKSLETERKNLFFYKVKNNTLTNLLSSFDKKLKKLS